jgi:hypothetical protein
MITPYIPLIEYAEGQPPKFNRQKWSLWSEYRTGNQCVCRFSLSRFEQREEAKDLEVNWHIAMMPGKRRALNLETASGQFPPASESLFPK